MTGRWAFDSALVLRDGGRDMTMLVVERDGSVSSMCGNGARAVARLFDELKITRTLRAGSLSMRISRSADGRRYRVPMGTVDITAITRPTLKLPELWWYDVGGEPHAVVRVEDLSAASIEYWGRQVVPVANCTVVSRMLGYPGRLRAATFERGVNRVTQSCGTGACAAAHAARDAGWIQGSASVFMHGHELRVQIDTGRNTVLEGEATVCRS